MYVYICVYVYMCVVCVTCLKERYALRQGVYMYAYMYVCMYAYMYVCMYICMYACVYVCMYVYMYVCLYACVICDMPERALSLAARVRAWSSADDVTIDNPCNAHVSRSLLVC